MIAQEIAGFLETAPPLYAMAHRPEGAPKGVVVIVGPFAEEKKAAQRALVAASRAFASAGYDVLRFDLRGTGDSGGEFSQADVAAWLNDVREAVAAAREMSGDVPITLLGLRFGASLAWLAASDETLKIDNLALWEPIVSGASYVRQNRQRSQIRAQMTSGHNAAVTESKEEFPAFDFDGFYINSKLHREMAQLELLALRPRIKNLLILQISGSSRIKKPLEDLRAYAENSDIHTEIDNVAVEAFWSSIGLIDTDDVRSRTLQWLDKIAENKIAENKIAEKREWQPLTHVEIAPNITAETLGWKSGNENIHGVLYTPKNAGKIERGLLLLHGWSGYRMGPGQLLTQTARALAKNGYAAYSFDFRGRGESQLEVAQASLNSMIRDATRAVPILREKTGVEKITLLGLCSGGEVALGASLTHTRIDSLALWSAPVFSGAFDLARQARRSRSALQKYAQKLLMPETWKKLVSGSLNWKMILRAVSGGRSNEDAAVVDKAPDTQSQMKAFEAFAGKLLFIYGGNDPETAPSRDFYQAFVDRTKIPAQFHEIAGANHNYYSVEWHREVIEHTLNWLKTLD